MIEIRGVEKLQMYKGKKILVIIPAYNESHNIEHTLQSLTDEGMEIDYLIINDCSKDNTLDILKRLNSNYVDLPINLGIGGGVQTGYKYAFRNGYDIAIQMDGDGQHIPKYIRDLIEPIIRDEADLVVGSRFLDKEGFQLCTGLSGAGIACNKCRLRYSNIGSTGRYERTNRGKKLNNQFKIHILYGKGVCCDNFEKGGNQMNIALRISLIIALLIYFSCIYMMLKKEKLNFKYSLLWIILGICMLFFIIFPSALEQLAKGIGIINYLNGLFAVVLFGLIILLMFLTTVASELSNKNRILIQECALLEERIRKLEKESTESV